MARRPANQRWSVESRHSSSLVHVSAHATHSLRSHEIQSPRWCEVTHQLPRQVPPPEAMHQQHSTVPCLRQSIMMRCNRYSKGQHHPYPATLQTLTADHSHVARSKECPGHRLNPVRTPLFDQNYNLQRLTSLGKCAVVSARYSGSENHKIFHESCEFIHGRRFSKLRLAPFSPKLHHC